MTRPCIIVDDEKLAREKIELYLSNIDTLDLIGSFSTAEAFLENWGKRENLILFLDINLPNLNGLELASMVNQGNQIIFTTAYSEYALDGFELDAVDYLLKPFSFKRFLRAITKAQNQSISNDSILIKEGKKTHQLQYSDIFYIEGMKEYIIWHTTRGKIIEYNSLKNLEKKLKSRGFYQVHKSFIVNFAKVEYFETNSLFIHEKDIPVGRTFKDSFNQLINF